MVDSLRSLEAQLAELTKLLRSVRATQIERADVKNATRDAADFYFRGVRESLVNGGVTDAVLGECDTLAHELLAATHRRAATATYRAKVKALHKLIVEAEKVVLLSTSVSHNAAPSDPTDMRIVETLKALLPSAALSYEQATVDLEEMTRLSWRGPATDLREALRETLDHLAPDKDVTAQPGFKLEAGTSGPTMKQKVRFILKNRGVSKGAMDTPEAVVVAVDEAVGTFVRSVYTRSSISTHTPTNRAEVVRIRDWVRVALCELLAI
jgi:hypothetical protein